MDIHLPESNVLPFLKSILSPPQTFSVNDRERIVSHLNALLRHFAIFALFLVPGSLFIFDRKVVSLLITAAIFVALYLTSRSVRKYRVLPASVSFISVMWGMITIIVWFSGGIDSYAGSAYLLLIVVTAALLGRRGIFIYSALSFLAGLIMLALRVAGITPPVYLLTSPFPRIFMWSFCLSAAAATLYRTLQYAERSIAAAEDEINKRGIIERELREKSKQIFDAYNAYYSYIDLSLTAAWEFDNDQRRLKVTPQFFQILGYAPGQPEFPDPDNALQFFNRFIHAEDIPGILRNLDAYKLHTNNTLFETTFRIRHRDGSWLWFLTRGRFSTIEGDKPGTKILGAIMDITRQKESEQKVIEQSKLIRRINEQSPDFIYIYDLQKDSNIYINKDIVKELGYAEGELPSDSIAAIRQIIHPDDIAQFDNYAEKAQNFRDNYILEFEYRLQDKSGAWRSFTGNEKVFEADENGVHTLIGTVREVTDKKKVEKELVIYQRAIETSQDAMFLINPDGSFNTINQTVCKMLGYSREEIMKLRIADIDHSFNEKSWPLHWEELRVKKAMNYESIHRTKDGRMIPVEISLSFIELDGNEYDVAFSHNISARKEAENTLRKNERQLSYAFSASSDSFWEWNYQTGDAYYSPRWYEMLGYKQAEGKTRADAWKLFCHPLDIHIMQEGIEGILSGSADNSFRVEIRLQNAEGNWIWAMARGKVTERDTYGYPVIVSGTFTDITDRKLTEQSLRESEKKFASAFRSSAVCVTITSVNEGRYVLVNDEFCRLTGYSLGEVIGKTSADLEIYLQPEDRKLIIDTIKAKGSIRNTEAQFKVRNGQVLTGLISAELLLLSGEQHIIMTYQDLTDRKRMEEELVSAKEKAEQMSRLKSNFLANMSHELRTPMIGILGYSEMLKDSAESSETRKMAETIHRSGKRLMKSLNLILDLSRIESGKQEIITEMIDIVKLGKNICHVFKPTALDKKLNLICDTPVQSIIMNTDEKIIREILSNLVDNAIKFTKEGFVKVSIETVFIDNARFVAFKIQDSGIGIAPENLGLIFEEFRQASEGFGRGFEGTGLGLTITKKFIESLGGTISVSSTLGIGTTFTVTLPNP